MICLEKFSQTMWIFIFLAGTEITGTSYGWQRPQRNALQSNSPDSEIVQRREVFLRDDL